MTCTFFGHKDTPESVKTKLRETVIDLIENHNADLFYVGNQGHFDFLAAKTLENLKELYPHIRYYIVLAYMPGEKRDSGIDFSSAIYPEGLENVPLRFAIDKRNRWMLDLSEAVVTYVEHNFGGAAKFKELAEKKNKTVINLVEGG